MGRSRYRVLEHDVGVKWDPMRTAAYVPSHFMVLNPIFCYVSPKIVIFHELLIVETRNKCHWIWHALNPKYVPLKQFQCIFPVKINKMWNFCLKLWFFRNHLSQRIDICSIRFSMPQILNIWHSSNFDAFFSVKINKMWNFGCFLNSPWQKTEKNVNLHREKVICKGLQICTYRFLGMLIIMHYVRTLCNKYFPWVIMVFLHFYGKV